MLNDDFKYLYLLASVVVVVVRIAFSFFGSWIIAIGRIDCDEKPGESFKDCKALCSLEMKSKHESVKKVCVSQFQLHIFWHNNKNCEFMFSLFVHYFAA